MLRLLNSVSSGHFAPADETTIRLVNRCLSVSWLCVEADKTAPTDGAAGNVVAKRMLGMGLEGARASSLSVLEVAAHKEKPGVLTPSVSKEKRDNASSGQENGNGLTVHVPDEGGRSPFLDEEDEEASP